MAHIILPRVLDNDAQVRLMQSDARFDVADNDDTPAALDALRRSIRAKAPPPTVPKVMLAGKCVFNCAYCVCRCSNEQKAPYLMPPRALAELAVKQAEMSCHGIFITSAIHQNADTTEEMIVETLRVIRRELGYTGYVHAKIMPGADPALIYQAGLYADRLSVNIEVANSEGYRRIAHNKNRENILAPMNAIHRLIREHHDPAGRGLRFARSQTTQLMAGSSGEDDHTILNLSGALYRKYRLARVYYTSFTYRHPAAGYDLPETLTPHWRMSRLYQADRLMQLYGFTAEELTPESARFLSPDIDPKAAWALRHPELYPVEVNTADYELLLRVPGIGLTYAQRIIKARRYCRLTHDSLRALGVSLKRARHFITAGGRFQGAEPGGAECGRDLYHSLEEPPVPEQQCLSSRETPDGLCL